jgi:hypothetical protein
MEEKTSFNRCHNDEYKRKQYHSTIKIFTGPFQDILMPIYGTESSGIIYALHGLANGETEPGEETCKQYLPCYRVVQLCQHG